MCLIGRELYEAFVKGYTMKQWGCDPRDVPASIITRPPVRTSFHDCYFDDIYQGIPAGGYTPIFERMQRSQKLMIDDSDKETPQQVNSRFDHSERLTPCAS
jgi:UDP-galactopyranose mutase